MNTHSTKEEKLERALSILIKDYVKVDCFEENYLINWASEAGYLTAVKDLLKVGADIDAGDGYPIQLAARNGHLELVKFLIQEGADISKTNYLAEKWAAGFGHPHVVEVLRNEKNKIGDYNKKQEELLQNIDNRMRLLEEERNMLISKASEKQT